MVKRSICIFPNFENIDIIHQLRVKYDPLHFLIPPHITLVHPFISYLTIEELQDHVKKAVREIKPFKVRLHGFSGAYDDYLFLNVKQGNDRLIQLRDNLYQGALAGYLYKKTPYIPHITIGKFKNDSALDEALKLTESVKDSFDTIITEIATEIIDDKEQSIIEFVVTL